MDASAYTVSIAGTIVLGNICGEGIAKVLNRQIGKGINLDRCCKSSHGNRSKAVYQSLYCKSSHGNRSKAVYQSLYKQDAEVHAGLLGTGQKRLIPDFLEYSRVRMKI